MSLLSKYQGLLDLGAALEVKDGDWKEEGGKLVMKGATTYQLEKNLLWDKIKSYASWETEIVADIRVLNAEIHGIHEVVSGDTLSKLGKHYLGNASKYMEIFNANKDQLKDPDHIKVGQKLKIPAAQS